jgi:hypothetical protein
MSVNELFWRSSVEDIKRGYVYNEKDEKYLCLMCGKSFEQGYIYQFENKLMEAKKAIKEHIEKDHGSIFDYLINMDKKYTGLTEIQKSLVESFYRGISDKEITKAQGNNSSTIRTQRFALREKAKQAKIYLAIIELMDDKKKTSNSEFDENNKNQLIEIHSGATMVDDRYAITEDERESTIKTYFLPKEGLKLKSFPAREKKKIIVLQKIVKSFEENKRYSEVEVNNVLKSIFDDFATIRRYLIEYGFMDRTKDCSEYWVKK